MILHTLGIISILSYFGAALLQGLHLFGKRTASSFEYLISTLVCLTLHGFILYKLIDTPLGQNTNWLIMFSFTLWIMNIFTFMMSLKAPIKQLCVLTYPLSALTLGLCLTGHHEVLSKPPQDVLMHIFISLFAMSLLTMASFQAILLALQNSLIKRHRSLVLRFLPPLQTMEGLLFVILWSSLGFLTASLGSGFFFQSTHLTQSAFPKTVLAIFAWGSLILLLGGRLLFGWRGPTAVRWTLVSTLLAVLSYFGTKALLL